MHDFLNCPLGHHLPSAHARARPHVNNVLGFPDGVFVVFDHHQGVAVTLEAGERLEQNTIVAWMQANRGLIQNIANALKVGAQLGGQSNALRLATRERGCGAVQAQIVETDFPHEIEPALYFLKNVACDFRVAAAQYEAGKK